MYPLDTVSFPIDRYNEFAQLLSILLWALLVSTDLIYSFVNGWRGEPKFEQPMAV